MHFLLKKICIYHFFFVTLHRICVKCVKCEQMRVRKLLTIVAVLAAGLLPVRAQWSDIYASQDAEYTEGIALYQQGQFATAQAHLQNYQDERRDTGAKSSACHRALQAP